MKNNITLACLLLVFQNIGAAQNSRIDSLRHVLAITNQDTTRVKAYQEICTFYQFNRPDSAIFYGYKGLALARKLKFPQGEIQLIFNLANAYEGLDRIVRVGVIHERHAQAERNRETQRLGYLRHEVGRRYQIDVVAVFPVLQPEHHTRELFSAGLPRCERLRVLAYLVVLAEDAAQVAVGEEYRAAAAAARHRRLLAPMRARRRDDRLARRPAVPQFPLHAVDATPSRTDIARHKPLNERARATVKLARAVKSEVGRQGSLLRPTWGGVVRCHSSASRYGAPSRPYVSATVS